MAVTPVKRIGEYVRDFDDDFLTVALFVENQALVIFHLFVYTSFLLRKLHKSHSLFLPSALVKR